MLHNTFNGMEHRAPCNHILSPYTHPQPLDWIKPKKYLNVVMLHIKLRTNIEANTFTLHPHLTSDIEIVQNSYFLFN